MTIIRFVIQSPQPPNLSIPAVPAVFSNYVWDVDTSTTVGKQMAARMRYRGQPYGVKELGLIEDETTELTVQDVVTGILDEQSAIGSAITSRLGSVDLTGIQNSVNQLRIDVDVLQANPGGGSGGVLVVTTVPTNLESGVLAAKIISY